MHWYKTSEYETLSRPEKHELCEWQQRNISQGRRKPRTREKSNDNHQLSALQQQVKELTELVRNSKSGQGNKEHPVLKCPKMSQRDTSDLPPSPSEVIIPKPASDDQRKLQHNNYNQISPRFNNAIISAFESFDDDDPRTELDSHADSPVVGKHAHIISYTGKYINVSGFTSSLGECKHEPTLSCVIAFDCPMIREPRVHCQGQCHL